MARVLISALPFTRGDINPYLLVTRALVRAGHEVDWMSVPEGLGEFAPLVEAAGAHVCASPATPAAPLPRGDALAALIADQAAYARAIRIPLAAASAQVERVRELLRTRAIDVVATDRGVEFAPLLIAAELERVPHAFVCAGLHLLVAGAHEQATEPARAAAVRRWIDLRALFKHHGLVVPMWGNQIVSPTLNTCFTTRACVGDVPTPPATELVGPCIASGDVSNDAARFPWDRLRRDGRIAYLSFGSLYSDASIHKLVATAAAALDVQLVVSTGALADTAFVHELPGDVLAVAYAPQLELLAKTRVFVTHGGFNSFNEALFHGVPMLADPARRRSAIAGTARPDRGRRHRLG